MQKFRFATVCFALILACGAGFAGEMDDLDAEELAMVEAMRNEPPITQADIDIIVKLSPQFDDFEDDMDGMTKLITDSGLTFARFQYVMSKVGMGIMMVMMPEHVTRDLIMQSGDVPEFLIPTDADLELIGANMDSIQAIMQ